MEKKYQLPKEFAEKWLTALRSGEYKQGTGQLMSYDNTYCCLGVACAMFGLGKKEIGSSRVIGGSSHDALNDFPNEIPNLLIGRACDNEFVYDCTNKNDCERLQFTEIADWIEANPELT